MYEEEETDNLTFCDETAEQPKDTHKVLRRSFGTSLPYVWVVVNEGRAVSSLGLVWAQNKKLVPNVYEHKEVVSPPHVRRFPPNSLT